MTKKQRKMLTRILLSFSLLVVCQFLPLDGWQLLFCFLAPYLIIGWDILRKAGIGIYNRQVCDENFLMAVASIGAFVIAWLDQSEDYNEAIAVLLFYQIGELFEGYAVGRSRKSIAQLMDIRPDSALLEVDGIIKEVSPEEVEVGAIIQVGIGDRIPLDAIIIEGSSTLNTSALTGESVPRTVTIGDSVASGCVNLSAVLRLQTTKPFSESTATRILELVENASARKSRPEAFITKFARYYTPTVCILALTLAIIPPLVRVTLLATTAEWTDWIYRALTFLVISCPCALVISIPLTFFAGIGAASREGILIKGANYLESLSYVDHIVFDKTGTLTRGEFSVTAVHTEGIAESELYELVALAEQSSPHPIAEGLCRAHQGTLDTTRLSHAEEIHGMGVRAIVDGKEILVGNATLLKDHGIPTHFEEFQGCVSHIAIKGRYVASIALEDTIKPTAKASLESLRACGVKTLTMLTGDSPQVAQQVAITLGLDEVQADLLPAQKVEHVEFILSRKSKKTSLVFVGDGINDAPVLSRADVGIAMGALGSDAAIESADIVLMDDDLSKIPHAIRIAKKAMGICKQNIYAAIGIKVLCLVLGAVGLANLWLAIFADVGVLVLAILNASRAMWIKKQYIQ